MSVATQSRQPQDGMDFMLRLQGRIYPFAQRGGQTSPSRISQQTTALPLSGRAVSPRRDKKGQERAARHKSVAEEMAVRIWERLPLASKSVDDFEKSEEIVRCFVQSYQQLGEMAAEASHLLETACRVHLHSQRDDQMDSERQEEAEIAKLRDCMDVTMPAAWLGPELDASTVVKEPPAALASLTKSLAVSVCQMVESFFTALEQLVDKEVVGLVEWHSESVCKFHFFRRLLVHKFDGQTNAKWTKSVWDTIDGFDVERSTTTKTTTTKGRHVHVHIRHEQQLMEAAKRPLGSPDLVIPKDVQQIVDEIPPWLSPFVRVAVGECFRERVIRRIEKEDKWEDKRVSKRVIERAVTYYDPAVTVGEFVLAGWGQREQAAEIERRAQVKRAERSGRRSKDAGLLAALMFGVGSLLLLLSLVFATKLLWPSVVVCVASFVPLNLAVFHNAKWRGVKASAESFFLVNMSGLFLTLMAAATMLAVVEKRLVPVLAAVTFFGFFMVVLFPAVRRLWPRASISKEEK